MIVQIRGTLVERTIERVVVDVQGVGYAAIVSLQTLADLPPVGAEVTLKTHLHVREDAHQLFGFATDGERRVFELCIAVSGIGPKLAMALLSAMRFDDLADTVTRGDIARLQRTPGVGKKTAERLVVELRDRFERLGSLRAVAPGAIPARATGTAATVASALVNLGYREQEAERSATEAVQRNDGAPIELLVREALRLLTG